MSLTIFFRHASLIREVQKDSVRRHFRIVDLQRCTFGDQIPTDVDTRRLSTRKRNESTDESIDLYRVSAVSFLKAKP